LRAFMTCVGTVPGRRPVTRAPRRSPCLRGRAGRAPRAAVPAAKRSSERARSRARGARALPRRALAPLEVDCRDVARSAPARRARVIAREMYRDAQEPRAERALAAIEPQRAESAHEGFLCEILGRPRDCRASGTARNRRAGDAREPARRMRRGLPLAPARSLRSRPSCGALRGRPSRRSPLPPLPPGFRLARSEDSCHRQS
jgi:hypothetical protein